MRIRQNWLVYCVLSAVFFSVTIVDQAKSEENQSGQSQQAPHHQHDSSKPVEITADNLAVDQNANTATFMGNVVATQDELQIHSHKMVVHYTNKSDDSAKPAKDKKVATSSASAAASGSKKKKESSAGSPEASAITKVEVFGDVVVTSNDDTAQGDHGNYNVKEQKIYLYDHVILTQGTNIVKGDRMIYDVASGQSQVFSGPSITETTGGSSKPGRVKGIFIPENSNSSGNKSPKTTSTNATSSKESQ